MKLVSKGGRQPDERSAATHRPNYTAHGPLGPAREPSLYYLYFYSLRFKIPSRSIPVLNSDLTLVQILELFQLKISFLVYNVNRNDLVNQVCTSRRYTSSCSFLKDFLFYLRGLWRDYSGSLVTRDTRTSVSAVF